MPSLVFIRRLSKSYVSSNAKKVLLDVEEKISRYMKELDEADAAESRPGALTIHIQLQHIAGIITGTAFFCRSRFKTHEGYIQ